MNTHFVLRNNYINKEGLQQIQLIYCANNQQLKLDTGVRVRPKDWNDSKQQILSSVTEIGKTSKELNDILIEKQKKVLTIVSDFKKEHDNGTSVSPDPKADYVKYKYYEVKKTIREEKPVLYHLRDYIDNRKHQLEINDPENHDLRSGQYKTLSHYESLYTDLVRFEKQNHRTYYFRDINKKFKDNLVNFYISKGSKKEKKKGLSNGTLKKKFAKLKYFLSQMTEDGVNKFSDYKNFGLSEFQLAKNDDNIYSLTIEEFQQLYHLPLNLEKLQVVRDFYILSCTTGLRWSDVSRIRKENIKNGKILMNSLKTKQSLIIPLNDISDSILKRYGYQLPPLSKAEIDRRLTLMWVIAKEKIPSLNEKTIYKYFVGTRMVEEFYPKYKLLSFHTSRKFFITFLIHNNVSIDQIKNITGHSGRSLSVFFRYVSGGNEDQSLNHLFRNIKNNTTPIFKPFSNIENLN